MATTPVILGGIPSGETCTLKLYAEPTAGTPDPTIANGSGDSMTEQTNAKTWYSADVTEALSGNYRAVVEDAAGDEIAVGWVEMADTTTPVFERQATAAQVSDVPTAAETRAEVDSNSTQLAAIVADTAEIGAAGAGLSAVPYNSAWDAEIQSECNDALVALGLDHLVSTSVTGADVANNSIFARLVSASATADWDTFNNQTDSLEQLSGVLDGTPSGVWDIAYAITTSGSFGELLADWGTTGSGLSAVPYNSAWDAEIQSECNDALVALGLDHLVGASVTGTDVVDNSIVAKLVSASATADWDDYVNTTDSLQAVRDRGDSAWTTGGGSSDPALLQSTTIATLSTQTSFTLTAGSADNDAYNGCMAVITDQSTSTQKAVAWVSDYVGSTKTVTLQSDPGVFTMATGDSIDIVAVPRQQDVAVSSRSSHSAADVWTEGTRTLTAATNLTSDGSAITMSSSGVVGTVNTVNTTTTNTDMVGTDNAALASVCTEARLAELDAANLPTDIDAILVDTAEIGAAGAGLSAVPWNSSWDVEVESECNDALVALGLDHLVSTSVTGTDVADNSIVAKLVSASATADWDDYVNTTDSLQAVRDQGDSAWTTATGFSTHSAADVRTEMDSNSTQLAAIVADTNELQGDWVNGGRLDLILDACATEATVTSGVAVSSLTTAAITDVWSTDTLTESYAADGAAFTPAQALYEICQGLTEFAISSTTVSVKKRDGTTEAATYTLDDATTPTSRTRAS